MCAKGVADQNQKLGMMGHVSKSGTNLAGQPSTRWTIAVGASSDR